jgi:uncharacterized protein (TIGR03437 family)
VHADGSQTIEESAVPGAMPLQSTTFVPTPISFANPTDQIFLQLYGTGLRHTSAIFATIGGNSVAIEYAGEQGTYPGLDQVNLQVPSSLAGAGTVNIEITANGQAANPVTTLIQ